MKLNRMIWLLALSCFLLTSCGMMRNMFRRKSGCPSNGKNVGAEIYLMGDPQGMKIMKRAKKFRS